VNDPLNDKDGQSIHEEIDAWINKAVDLIAPPGRSDDLHCRLSAYRHDGDQFITCDFFRSNSSILCLTLAITDELCLDLPTAEVPDAVSAIQLAARLLKRVRCSAITLGSAS
jgi:hypothetical protein